jgi:hypothetical protein
MFAEISRGGPDTVDSQLELFLCESSDQVHLCAVRARKPKQGTDTLLNEEAKLAMCSEGEGVCPLKWPVPHACMHEGLAGEAGRRLSSDEMALLWLLVRGGKRKSGTERIIERTGGESQSHFGTR